ncbi:MAG: xanthine dehydrogenase family protein subunit M [Rubrivivax sp.]|nr:xanthine dehydrogenase family protein subunit M [Rubrivivax sp.]
MTFEAVDRYVAPTQLRQALALLAQPGGATVLAGGTDLMPQAQAGRLKPARTLLNIRRIAELDGVRLDEGSERNPAHGPAPALVLGALVTMTRLRRDPLVRAHAPLLAEAAEHFASEQIRNTATLGGNLCNASPAGDTLTPLLALDAEVELVRLADDGTVLARRLPIGAFFTGPGRAARGADELLGAVRVPVAAPGAVIRIAVGTGTGTGTVWRFHKGGTRPALDISPIAIALVAARGADGLLGGVRIALGAVAPTPMRAQRAEALLEGRRLDAGLAAAAAEAAAAECRPIDDVRASAWYRRELVRNMLQRMLDDVAQA